MHCQAVPVFTGKLYFDNNGFNIYIGSNGNTKTMKWMTMVGKVDNIGFVEINFVIGWSEWIWMLTKASSETDEGDVEDHEGHQALVPHQPHGPPDAWHWHHGPHLHPLSQLILLLHQLLSPEFSHNFKAKQFPAMRCSARKCGQCFKLWHHSDGYISSLKNWKPSWKSELWLCNKSQQGSFASFWKLLALLGFSDLLL